MEKRTRDRTRLAVGLCAVMLAFCLFALGRYLAPVLRMSAASGPDGAAFGMVLIDIADDETADSYHVENCGVYVLAVQEESLADLAGVYSGDRLLSVNDCSVMTTSEFVAMQDQFQHGQQVRMDFQRRNDEAPYAVTLVWNEE